MTHLTQAENGFYATVRKNGMMPLMKRGCLVGLSGGADSVLLLFLVQRLLRKEGVPILALHVHHGIRGEEGDRDLAFSRELCRRWDVPFEEYHASVPTLAAQNGESVEQCARRVRYAAFEKAARSHGLGAILTAHHASDSAETVLLNLSRGAGGRGLCGIPPIRWEGDVPVLRPLIALSRTQIEAALGEAGISFVTDSTNVDTVYRRNYVRQELMPRFLEMNPSFEKAVCRMSESLATDMDYLDGEAKRHYDEIKDGDSVSVRALLSLHEALRYRVLLLLYRETFPSAPLPEKVHFDALFSRAQKKGSFTVAFPEDALASVRGDRLSFIKEKVVFRHSKTPVGMGETTLADGGKLLLLEKGSLPEGVNVYKLSIHRDLSSATINGGLYVRSREEGDAYRFGGVTHKLKKLFSDAHLSPDVREHIPVLCDGDGILWVPHFGVRNDGCRGTEPKDLTLYYLPPKTLL